MERLAEEYEGMMLESDHSCDMGPERGQPRLIINYVSECRECLAQFLDHVLKENTPMA